MGQRAGGLLGAARGVTSMEMQDWAIVVGITAYPGLGELGGPERDARDFYDWVTSERGGAIDPDSGRATLIISSDCQPAPPYESFLVAKPTMEQVNDAFLKLYVRAEENQKAGHRRRVGRRLYMYFAGHGFEPEIQVVLLTANAAQGIWNHHVSGTGWAEWFYTAGYFQEVLLFMDCCRDIRPIISANPVLIQPTTGGNDEKRRFYAYATDLGKKSWERKMADGLVHGVFSTTLMKGLRGGACDSRTGEITSRSLQGYLMNNMKYFFDEKERADPQIRKQPRVPEYEPDFIIARLDEIPKYPVTVSLPPELQNRELMLVSGAGQNLRIERLRSEGPTLSLELAKDVYAVVPDGQFGGQPKELEVRGIGPEDVSL